MTDHAQEDDNMEGAIEGADNFVQARPLTAIAIAILVGALAARFLF